MAHSKVRNKRRKQHKKQNEEKRQRRELRRTNKRHHKLPDVPYSINNFYSVPGGWELSNFTNTIPVIIRAKSKTMCSAENLIRQLINKRKSIIITIDEFMETIEIDDPPKFDFN